MPGTSPGTTPDQLAAPPGTRLHLVAPFHFMARQHFADLAYQLIFAARKLSRPGLAPLLVRGDRSGSPGAVDQVLDLDFAARLLVRSLNDHARGISPVRIFELVAHVLWIAEIQLRANVRVAQRCDHLLIIGNAIAIEHGHDNGPELRPGVELAQHRKRGLQPRHADGKARGRHRLAAKTRYQSIIASAATDRPEAHRTPLFVLGFERQLYFIDRARVVFEAAHYRAINANAIGAISGCRNEPADFFQLFLPLPTDDAFTEPHIDVGFFTRCNSTAHQGDVGGC